MSVSTVLGILGILISLLFGAWGVYLAVVRRYPGEITFVREQTIGLFDAIVKNLPEMAVLYKSAPVSPNVVLVKGSLVNTGAKDISASMIERPISLSLPAGSKWLSATVISASQDVKSFISILDPCAITFDNGLLRRNEFIRFQGLAELSFPQSDSTQSVTGSIEERLKNLLKFEHRIEDTGSVKSFELQQSKGLGRKQARYIGLLIVGLVIVILFAIIFAVRGLPSRFAYDYQVGSNQFARVTVERLRPSSVKVKSLDGKFSATVTTDEFFSKCRNNPVVVPDRSEILPMLAATIFVYIFVPSILISFRLKDYWTNRKLRRLLGLDRPQSAIQPQGQKN